jgi:hypothetical protein
MLTQASRQANNLGVTGMLDPESFAEVGLLHAVYSDHKNRVLYSLNISWHTYRGAFVPWLPQLRDITDVALVIPGNATGHHPLPKRRVREQGQI